MRRFLLLVLLASVCAGLARADGAGNPAPASSDSGEYYDKDGNPTYKIGADGTVDWFTFIGYRMYGANCLQCHGPDALGSSYAPSLVDSLKSLTTQQVQSTIINGKRDVTASQELVMPSFGENKNVMCYLEPIYVYLRARSDGALGRERPVKHEPKPDGWEKKVDSCFG
ncbi:c-type cytochrome, methanol metabolism-related [Methylocella sp.]|uniref:c-type cytochrome, methanol metabolism-related n=1 Tax=Methylocella sp. TaxID=1978226 RepID=UPI0035AF89A8